MPDPDWGVLVGGCSMGFEGIVGGTLVPVGARRGSWKSSVDTEDEFARSGVELSKSGDRMMNLSVSSSSGKFVMAN